MTAVQKSTGCAVMWAKSVDEGLWHLRSAVKYRLVLCDFQLGKQTALDFLTSVQAGQSRPPVHILTSSGDEVTRAQCIAAGATSFASKHDIAADLAKWCKELTEALRKAA